MVLHVLPGWIPRFGPVGRLGVVRGPSQRPVSGSLVGLILVWQTVEG